MNTYEIDGILYRTMNEYDAVKQAYKMALRVVMDAYIGNETWSYAAIFPCGKASVTVKKVGTPRL